MSINTRKQFLRMSEKQEIRGVGGKTCWLNGILHLKNVSTLKKVNKQRKYLEMELGTSLDRMFYLSDCFM